MGGPPIATDNPESQPRDKPADGRTERLGDGYITGNLTADPELRYTTSGTAVVKIRVAHTPRVLDPATKQFVSGETEYYPVEIWRAQAERAMEDLVKGDRIVAVGTWQKRYWTNAEGKEQVVTELRATEVGPSMLFHGARSLRPRNTPAGGSDANT